MPSPLVMLGLAVIVLLAFANRRFRAWVAFLAVCAGLYALYALLRDRGALTCPGGTPGICFDIARVLEGVFS